MALAAHRVSGVDASRPEVSLIPWARIIKDSDNSLTPDKILKLPASAKPYDLQVASFGFTDSTYWFLIPVNNHGTAPLNRLLVFDHTWLDDVQITLIEPDGTTRRYHGGDLFTFGQRSLLHQKINFELKLPPGHNQLLVRVRTGDPFLVGMTLWERSAFFKSDSNEKLRMGSVYGALLALLFYNLLLFCSIKEKVYAAYVIYVFAFLVMHAAYNGFLFPLLWPDSPVWSNWAHSIFIYLYIASGLFFTIQFLELKTKLYRAYRWARNMAFVLIASFVLTAAVGGYPLHVATSILWILIYAPFVLLLGIYSFKAGNRSARFFLLAAVAGVIGFFITALSVIGLIPYSTLAYHAVDYGMLIDAILLSLALADRFRLARTEAAMSRDQILELSRSQTAVLEKAVTQRTLTLEKANQSNAELMHDLEIKTQAAEKSSADKTRFLASASHDLRQPMQAMALNIETLIRRLKQPENREVIEALSDSHNLMSRMMNSLLDISKLDAGVVEVNLEPIHLEIVIENLKRDYIRVAENKGVTFESDLMPACVYSDLIHIECILGNLIANAVRYTKEGGRIRVSCRQRQNRVVVEIRDTGIGIPQDQLKHIFLEFYQISHPERDRQKGLGLGLSIVDRLVHLLPDHELEVFSKPGHGSSFRISMPVAEGSPPVNTEIIISEHEPFPGMRLLLLEDDRLVRKAAVLLLHQWGCFIADVGSSAEAIAVVKNGWAPDAIIADYSLPGDMTGLQTVKSIRKLLKQSVPALILTGETDAETLRNIERSGLPLLHKPVAPAKLMLFLRQCRDNR